MDTKKMRACSPLLPDPGGEVVRECLDEIERLQAALADMLCGWRYIRQSHGDLYGVGWDRAQDKAEQALGIGAGDPVPDHMFVTPNLK